MPTIRSQHVDIDLSRPPPGQSTGWKEQTTDQLLAATPAIPWFSDARPELMTPRSQWKTRIDRVSAKYRKTTKKIYSQGGNGSCVGFGAAQLTETTMVRRYGSRFWVSLSGMSVYKRIGSSAGSGAYIPDGIKAAQDGILPTDTPENKVKFEHTHSLLSWSQKLAAGWITTGRWFRITQWAKCYGADEVMSALINGFGGIVGRSGHCIPYLIPAYSGNNFLAGYANSWDEDWGDNGWGYDSERTFGNLTLYVALEVSTRPGIDVPALAL